MKTLAHLFQLQKDGWSADNVDPTPYQEDCRQRAAILRLLLSGGLFTQNIISTHMHKKETHCDCSVGGVMDVEHISWHCSHYSHLRTTLPPDVWNLVEASKPCFRYATILTKSDRSLSPFIGSLQRMLIDIWQHSIRNYLGVNDASSSATSTVPVIPRALAASGYIIERGHWIDSAPGGGVYCRRCGALVKHRRLKISYRDCPFSSVGESELLDNLVMS